MRVAGRLVRTEDGPRLLKDGSSRTAYLRGRRMGTEAVKTPWNPFDWLLRWPMVYGPPLFAIGTEASGRVKSLANCLVFYSLMDRTPPNCL